MAHLLVNRACHFAALNMSNRYIHVRCGYRGRQVEAPPQQILAAARHLASHYQKAGRELPPTLAELLSRS